MSLESILFPNLYNIYSNSITNNFSISKPIIQDLSASPTTVLNANSMIGGIFIYNSGVSSLNPAPTAADILNLIPNAAIGDSFSFYVSNPGLNISLADSSDSTVRYYYSIINGTGSIPLNSTNTIFYGVINSLIPLVTNAIVIY